MAYFDRIIYFLVGAEGFEPPRNVNDSWILMISCVVFVSTISIPLDVNLSQQPYKAKIINL